MAYSDFTLDEIENKFGIIIRFDYLQFDIDEMEPSDSLKKDLKIAKDLPVVSEKAKSEWIVVPILRELLERNDNFFTIYSGDNLNADSEQGLKGKCDFILTKNVGTVSINYPIIQIVEAKKNDIELGIAQCAAQIIGAKVYNQKKGTEIKKIYGCVTNGDNWLFMKLEGDTIYADKNKYGLLNLPQLLGVFQNIIDYYKEHLN